MNLRPEKPMPERTTENRGSFTRIPAGRHGLAPEAVLADQRARVQASMIILAADAGYPSTSVADLISHAGISRRTFYELFENREACFISSRDALLRDWRPRFTLALKEAAQAPSKDNTGSLCRSALQTLIELVQADPQGARALFIETLNAGATGQQTLSTTIRSIERQLDRAFFPQRQETLRPSAIATAILGGVWEIITERLRTNRVAELPELVDELAQWMLTYRGHAALPVLDPLDHAATSDTNPPPSQETSSSAPADFPLWREGSGRPVNLSDPHTRILRATLQLTGEQGYLPLSASAIQRTARVSPQTFRRYFNTKTEAFLAAYQAGNQATIEYSLKAYSSAPNWPAAGPSRSRRRTGVPRQAASARPYRIHRSVRSRPRSNRAPPTRASALHSRPTTRLQRDHRTAATRHLRSHRGNDLPTHPPVPPQSRACQTHRAPTPRNILRARALPRPPPSR